MKYSREVEEFADVIATAFNRNPYMWKLLDNYEDKQKWRKSNEHNKR
jgi:hypothetical protein